MKIECNPLDVETWDDAYVESLYMETMEDLIDSIWDSEVRIIFFLYRKVYALIQSFIHQ